MKHIYLDQLYMIGVEKNTMFPFRHTIFFRGANASGLMDDAMVKEECTKRVLDKFDRILCLKD